MNNPIEETLFDGASNLITFQLSYDDVPITFETFNTTLMELNINGVTLSSDDGDITWDNDGNVFINSTNASKITHDTLFSTSLMVYDDEHPEPSSGQLLIHPEMSYSKAKIKVVNAKV